MVFNGITVKNGRCRACRGICARGQLPNAEEHPVYGRNALCLLLAGGPATVNNASRSRIAALDIALLLLSLVRPRCLRCSTPHVTMFPFLCGLTLSRCPGYATRCTPYPLLRLRICRSFLMAVTCFHRYGAQGGFFDLLPKVELA
jgi:hypothetical protein